MEVTLEGMVMDWRDLHPMNALSPMEVTLEGMVMDWREMHLTNASFPMEVMPSMTLKDGPS